MLLASLYTQKSVEDLEVNDNQLLIFVSLFIVIPNPLKLPYCTDPIHIPYSSYRVYQQAHQLGILEPPYIVWNTSKSSNLDYKPWHSSHHFSFSLIHRNITSSLVITLTSSSDQPSDPSSLSSALSSTLAESASASGLRVGPIRRLGKPL